MVISDTANVHDTRSVRSELFFPNHAIIHAWGINIPSESQSFTFPIQSQGGINRENRASDQPFVKIAPPLCKILWKNQFCHQGERMLDKYSVTSEAEILQIRKPVLLWSRFFFAKLHWYLSGVMEGIFTSQWFKILAQVLLLRHTSEKMKSKNRNGVLLLESPFALSLWCGKKCASKEKRPLSLFAVAIHIHFARCL